MIVSEGMLSCILYFNVMFPNEWSGRCFTSSGINISIPQVEKEDFSLMEVWPGKFTWKYDNLQSYTDQLTSDETVKYLSNFLSEIDTESEVNINDFTKQLSDN